ncbi:MAG: TonB-dependent receptor [Pseudomonadota bacterium]
MTLVVRALPVLAATCLIGTGAFAEEARKRQIEEVVVTAEKREATVSDTSISITAFSAEAIEDMGLQGADEMVNYIPATTRDAYDIRIRGVGRNFRALGGDPGVATYYNGVYSPDFGIAASENALYDLERVEVLRGPQGTLYGRNSIGGALNYVTKQPSYDWNGEFRTQVGNFATREFYGFISGPIIEDTLALRLVGVKRDRDGSQENIAGEDVDSTHDRNITMSLNWRISDTIEVTLRGNDRESDRLIGSSVLLTEGSGADRGTASTSQYVLGLREVPAGTAGAFTFTNPLTGEVKSALHRRPGVDSNGWPYMPNPRYGQTYLQGFINGSSAENPTGQVAVNMEGGDCRDYPSTNNACNAEFFGHKASQSDITWDISDSMSVKYIFGHTDFVYTYNQDLDNSAADFSNYRQTVEEDVQNKSHEIQLNWTIGERFSATSGLYYFDEVRRQQYSLTNSILQYTQAFSYGALEPWIGWLANHQRLGSAGDHKSIIGRWQGDERGDVYEQDNWIHNRAKAAYTQGTYEFNDKFRLVVGLRWAEDIKTAVENRSLYFEQAVGVPGGFMNFINGPTTFACGPIPAGGTPILECLSGAAFYPGGAAGIGMTPLAMLNVIWGRATITGDPANPIAPVCALGDPTCTTPLLLGGFPFSQNQMTSGGDSWSDVNYRVNLDWTPNDDMLMYFSVTTGYRAGGYSLGVTDARDQPRDSSGVPTGTSADLGDPFTYDQEEVISYEIGYKGMHLDNTLQVNASLYRYNYDNYQDRLNVFDPVRNRGVNVVQNANSATNTGFEVETTWLATDNLTLGGNYSYTKAEYDEDYLVVVEDNPNLPGSLFGSPTTNPELFVQNAKGFQLKRIPKHKATGWASYRWEIASGSITARTSVAFTGEYYANGVRAPYDLVPDRTRVDASLVWRDNYDRWSVRLFVDNLTDEKMLRGIGSGGENENWASTASILYPRYYGLDVKYAWR